MSGVDVSIVVPFFNAAPTLERAVDSAFMQVFPGTFELILVDDHSTDNSRQLALRCLSGRPNTTSLLSHQKNRGLAAAKNTGVWSANGWCVMFLDADDRIESDMLAKLYAVLKQNQSIAYAWPTYHLLTKSGDPIRQQSERNGSGVLFRRSAFHRVGLFNEELRLGGDTEMYARMDVAGLAGRHVPEAIYCYYQTPNSLTRRGSPKPS